MIYSLISCPNSNGLSKIAITPVICDIIESMLFRLFLFCHKISKIYPKVTIHIDNRVYVKTTRKGYKRKKVQENWAFFWGGGNNVLMGC